MSSVNSKNLRSLLCIAEAARILSVSEKTVRRKIANGELFASRVGAQWRIRSEDLEAYLARNRNWCPLVSTNGL